MIDPSSGSAIAAMRRSRPQPVASAAAVPSSGSVTRRAMRRLRPSQENAKGNQWRHPGWRVAYCEGSHQWHWSVAGMLGVQDYSGYACTRAGARGEVCRVIRELRQAYYAPEVPRRDRSNRRPIRAYMARCEGRREH